MVVAMRKRNNRFSGIGGMGFDVHVLFVDINYMEVYVHVARMKPFL
jgi:hypothetical protein